MSPRKVTRRTALIIALVALLVPAIAAAAWIAAPEEVELPVIPPVATVPEDAPQPQPEPAPHSGRLSAAEQRSLTAAVNDVEASASEAELAAEGRLLFRSVDVAKDGESCQSCHTEGGANPALGTTPHPTFAGDFIGPRDPPSLWGVADTAPYEWDGSVATLDAMVGATIDNHFKPERSDDQGEVARQTAALVAYLRTLDPPRTAFDRGRMSEAAQRGEELFVGKAGCIACHGGPLFTDNALHDNDVPQMPGANDPGAKNPPGAFNTPQLRDLVNSAPYMHNGSLRTLREVVEFYDHESSLPALNLTQDEVDDLVEYMEAL
ncbi:MAG TPA: c-type cytochrome [Thermoleophilaceae bacterium]|nr:c-type cytochrome [Thermoleophilaceae bacterium]